MELTVILEASSSRLVDNLANEYTYPDFRFGNKGSVSDLVANIATKVTVAVKGFSEEATSIALIHMVFAPDEWPGHAFSIQFRNLPINAETKPPGTAQNPPAVTTTPRIQAKTASSTTPETAVREAFDRLIEGIRTADVAKVMGVYWNSPRLTSTTTTAPSPAGGSR